ncbi:MAG: Rha family transcriptional regulator, partial [Campylobacter sp.]|uniref:Rha family transcriptional regulator n=1 Tax=Campylobacter sp. TaxID=205 RepID=UPI001B684B0E
MSALIPINNVNVAFEIVGNEIFANSLQIAEVFDKGHHNVLRLISNLPKDEFFTQNFKESSYLNKQNRKQPCYNLTRDGFSLLVMGFTGQKAYRWKIEFIKAFNLMEAELTRLKAAEQNSQP